MIFQKPLNMSMIKIEQNKLQNLCREFGLSFVALFGSRVKKEKSFKQDFDVAVWVEEPLDGDRELELIGRFSQILETDKVDVVLLNFASPLLQYEVSQEGMLLFERTAGSFNNFRCLAMMRWNDNKKFAALRTDYIKGFLHDKYYA